MRTSDSRADLNFPRAGDAAIERLDLGGQFADTAPRGQLARIDAERIVYTEHLMRKEGYAPRQIWTAGESETRVVPGGNV